MDTIFVFSTSNYTLCNNNKKKKTFKIDRHSNRKDPILVPQQELWPDTIVSLDNNDIITVSTRL